MESNKHLLPELAWNYNPSPASLVSMIIDTSQWASNIALFSYMTPQNHLPSLFYINLELMGLFIH
jgi:hypothetical protein